MNQIESELATLYMLHDLLDHCVNVVEIDGEFRYVLDYYELMRRI